MHRVEHRENLLHMSPSPLGWRHNERDGVSNHQPHDCLLNRLFGRRSKKTSKLRVTGLCAGNSPGTGEFPAQMASNAENVSIWWRHHGKRATWCALLVFRKKIDIFVLELHCIYEIKYHQLGPDCATYISLTKFCLVPPYGDIDLGQYWVR